MPDSLLELSDFELQLDKKRRLKVNLKLRPGQAHQLGGKSGGGKTTLLRGMALLTRRIDGKIFFQGKESAEFSPWEWRRKVCYLAQKPAMIPGTVRDNLTLPASLKISERDSINEESFLADLQKLGLSGDILDSDTAVISGGEASRVAIIRALNANPSVILADEITAPLDDISANMVVETLIDWSKGENRAVILVAHQDEVWKDALCCETDIYDFVVQDGSPQKRREQKDSQRR